MREFTVTIWGLAAVALGHWVGGLDWVGSAFLFFPAFGLASGVLNNEGRRIVKNAVVFVALLLVAPAVPQVTARLLSALPQRCSVDPTGLVVIGAIVTAALWAAFSCLAELPAVRTSGSPSGRRRRLRTSPAWRT